MYLTLIHINGESESEMEVGPFESYPEAAEAGLEFLRVLSEKSNWLKLHTEYTVVPVPSRAVSVEDGLEQLLNETIVVNGFVGGWAEVVDM